MVRALGLVEVAGLGAGDPFGVGVLETAEGEIDASAEPCAAGPELDVHAPASRARTHTICPFLIVLPVVTPERWFGYPAVHKCPRALSVPTKTVV